MDTYRILSIDGGGVRGLLVSVILEQLDERVPGWRDRIDLFAGTSTGGIIALGLAKEIAPSALRSLYYDRSPDIFANPWPPFVRDGLQFIAAGYSNAALRSALVDEFGDMKLRTLKHRVLISAFDLDNEDPNEAKRSWKPKFFHNFPGKDSDGGRKVVDVAMATSAAPTFFPTVDGFIDGGVVANNPAMAALAQTQDERAKIEPRPGLKDIKLLSIGTGFLPRRVEGPDHNWGYVRWAEPLVRLIFDGLGDVPHYQCAQLLGDGYYRVNHRFPPGHEIEMDDWSARDELVRIGEIEMKPDLDQAAEWIAATW